MPVGAAGERARCTAYVKERAVRVDRLLAALEDDAVAGADGQGHDLRQRVRARLKDYEQHPERRRALLQDQPVGQLGASQHLTASRV